MDYKKERNEDIYTELDEREFGKLGGIQWFILATMVIYVIITIMQKVQF